MNASGHEGEALRRSLHDEADSLGPDLPPHLSQVQGRARGIRRRRRTVAAVAAVAALAIATPLVWQITDETRSNPLPPAGPTQTIAPDPSQTASVTDPQPGGLTMDLRNLPTGNTVGVGWLDTSAAAFVLHRSDDADGNGTTVMTKGNEPTLRFATLADGRTVAQTASQVVVWDSNGSITHTESSRQGLAVDTAHRNIAWVRGDGVGRVLIEGSEKPRSLNEGQNTLTSAVSIDSTSADCGPSVQDDPSCAVVFNSTDGPVIMYSNGLLNPALGDEENPGPMSSVSDWRAEDDGITGAADGRDADTGCGLLVTFNSGVPPVQCDRVYGTISTDASRITVLNDDPDRSPADGGADMTDRLAVFTLGEQDLSWQRVPSGTSAATDASVGGIAWVNDTELVAKVWQDGAWTLVRFDAQGNATQVAPPLEGDLTFPRYALEVLP